MRFSSVFRRSLWLVLPAVLAFSGCSDDDKPVAPDQARVRAVHAAINNSTRPIKVTVGTQVGPSIAYGASSEYQTVSTGNLTVTAAIDAAGGATLYSTPQTIAKDKTYSFFAYNVAGQSAGSVSGLFVEDNLTAPASGKAKVRLVHVGLGLESPLTLSRTPDGGGTLEAVTTPTAAGNASPFVEIAAGTGSYNLSNASNSAIQPAAGGTVLATAFAAGGIYSVIVRGTTVANAPTTTERFTLQLVKHN